MPVQERHGLPVQKGTVVHTYTEREPKGPCRLKKEEKNNNLAACAFFCNYRQNWCLLIHSDQVVFRFLIPRGHVVLKVLPDMSS